MRDPFLETPPYGAMTQDMAKWLRENSKATEAEFEAAVRLHTEEARQRLEAFINTELFADLRRTMAIARSTKEPT